MGVLKANEEVNMFRLRRSLAALALILFATSPAAALYTEYKREEFGPAEKAALSAPGDAGWTLRHSSNRVYLQETGWSGWGQVHDELIVACQGDVDAANRALAAFAAIPAERREIRLFPGPGFAVSLKGEKSPCDWLIQWTRHVQMPRGDRKTTTETSSAVLTMYIARSGPIPPADPRAGQWINELNDGRFPVRQRASQALAELGDAALPALQKAVKEAPTIEQKRRVEQLLDRLKPIHLERVKLPAGMPIVSLNYLLEHETKNWHSGDLGKSWGAAVNICAWADYSDAIVPLLAEAAQDSREQVRELAVRAITRLGKRAAAIVPTLQAALPSAAAAVRDSLRQATAAVQDAPENPELHEQARQRKRLNEDIAQYCRSAH
jgi:hypothetical protein